ncbi:conserved hypothetical protein [gamma proteobacterium NOR5-3]|nr:conserved hypothetical protein [gamma proteobacterium NOR5-3]
MDFLTITQHELDNCDPDALDFGVIRMDRSGVVVFYNVAETRISGLSKSQVEGRAFFSEIGICMHNFMVGHKFEQPGDLDELVDYVLTLRMDPTPVTLRLLRQGDEKYQYLLIQPI